MKFLTHIKDRGAFQRWVCFPGIFCVVMFTRKPRIFTILKGPALVSSFFNFILSHFLRAHITYFPRWINLSDHKYFKFFQTFSGWLPIFDAFFQRSSVVWLMMNSFVFIIALTHRVIIICFILCNHWIPNPIKVLIPWLAMRTSVDFTFNEGLVHGTSAINLLPLKAPMLAMETNHRRILPVVLFIELLRWFLLF